MICDYIGKRIEKVVFRFFKCQLIAKKNEVKYSRTCCMLFILKCDDGSNKFFGFKNHKSSIKKSLHREMLGQEIKKCNRLLVTFWK
jgi:hypothetical protein